MDATTWKKYIDFEYEVVKGRKPLNDLVLLADILDVTATDRMKQRKIDIPTDMAEERMWEYYIDEYRKEEKQRDLDFLRYSDDD